MLENEIRREAKEKEFYKQQCRKYIDQEFQAQRKIVQQELLIKKLNARLTNSPTKIEKNEKSIQKENKSKSKRSPYS